MKTKKADRLQDDRHTHTHTHIYTYGPSETHNQGTNMKEKSSQLVVIWWAFLLILGQERALNSFSDCRRPLLRPL